MIRLTNGENVRWINPETGGHETGNIVNCHDMAVCSQSVGHGWQEFVLVALTYGGLAFVPRAVLQRIPMRSEWEQPTEKVA